MPASLINDPKHWRDRAKEARAIADEMKDPDAKQAMLGIARNYVLVPVGNLHSEILVMQSAQNWHRQRATDRLDGTWDRCVLVER
jgi:hypothetical protein